MKKRKKRDVIAVTGILPNDGDLTAILGEDYELWMPLYLGGVPRNIGANVQDVDELAVELSVKLWDVRLNQFGLCLERMSEYYIEWWRTKDGRTPETPVSEITPDGVKEVMIVTASLWVSAEWMSFTSVRPPMPEWIEDQYCVLRARYSSGAPEGEESVLRAVLERADANMRARAPAE